MFQPFTSALIGTAFFVAAIAAAIIGKQHHAALSQISLHRVHSAYLDPARREAIPTFVERRSERVRRFFGLVQS